MIQHSSNLSTVLKLSVHSQSFIGFQSMQRIWIYLSLRRQRTHVFSLELIMLIVHMNHHLFSQILRYSSELVNYCLK